MHAASEQLTHASDCATHNSPALPAGRCDCGAVELRIAELEAAISRAAKTLEAGGDPATVARGLRLMTQR